MILAVLVESCGFFRDLSEVVLGYKSFCVVVQVRVARFLCFACRQK